MFVRKNSAKLGLAGVTGLAVSAMAFAVLNPAGAATPTLNLTLNQGAAHDATPIDNSVASTGSIVFAGSDTIQYVVADLADAWNGSSKATTPINGKTYNILSYNALADDGTAVTPIGGAWNGIDGTTYDGSTPATSIVTPNGSGGGLKLLGATDDAGGSVISFARSSSAPDTSDTLKNGKSSDGTGYPFALDTVVLAVSAKNTTAPATLSDADVLGIYSGAEDNWSDVGGKAGDIDPLVPKSGSGTAKFFGGQVDNISLAAGGSKLSDGNGGLNGIPNTYKPTATSAAVPVPEHSGDPLIADANAIVPISLGRALQWNLKNPTKQVRIIGGFKEQRALWIFARTSRAGDEARGQSHVNPDVYAGGDVTKAVLGNGDGSGFFCSEAAQSIIKADGFYPLSSAYCGKPQATSGDIVPASGGDHIAPATMYIANPLLDVTATDPGQTASPSPGQTASPSPSQTASPSPSQTAHAPAPETAAHKKLSADKAKLKKLKKKYKKAHGAKKAALKKKIAKLNKTIKKDKKNVAAGK